MDVLVLFRHVTSFSFKVSVLVEITSVLSQCKSFWHIFLVIIFLRARIVLCPSLKLLSQHRHQISPKSVYFRASITLQAS